MREVTSIKILAVMFFICFGSSVFAEPVGFQLSQNSCYKQQKERIYNVMQKQARYLISTVKPWKDEPSMKLLTESKSGEHHIRPNTHAAAGFSFLCRFGDYDAKVVGIEKEALINDYIVPMLRYLVSTHKTGTMKTDDGRKWGKAWQSAHWAHALGRAAWWNWNKLPHDVQEGVKRVVVYEADRIANTKPPHQLKNDSKSEENAWNSQILSIAVLLMPEHANRKFWEEKLQEWVISSYLRPADVKSEKIVDGKPLKDQFNGANIYDDFTLENHHIIHPDYMAAWVISMHLAFDYTMTGRKPLDAFIHNIEGIYEQMKWFLLPDGGFLYPNGQDWRVYRNVDWILNHALCLTFFNDSEALRHLENGLDCAEKMQARHKSGAVYGKGEYFFASTQQHLLYWLAESWISLNHATKEITEPGPDKIGVKMYDSGKIIINRSKNAVHSVSWGKSFMVQCLPIAKDRVISPDQSNGIGFIRLKGQKYSLRKKLKDIKIDKTKDAFTAVMKVVHGDCVEAVVTVKSNADGSMDYSEKLTVLKDIETVDVATCFWGVLNNPTWPYETGKRTVKVNSEVVDFVSKSGKTAEFSGNELNLDDKLIFSSNSPMKISYNSAKYSKRARVTDSLFLNRINEERKWRKGDVISDVSLTVKPVK